MKKQAKNFFLIVFIILFAVSFCFYILLYISYGGKSSVELNIIDVYNLKFKDKLTIPQVASKLDMSEDNVIEALNELISIAQ